MRIDCTRYATAGIVYHRAGRVAREASLKKVRVTELSHRERVLAPLRGFQAKRRRQDTNRQHRSSRLRSAVLKMKMRRTRGRRERDLRGRSRSRDEKRSSGGEERPEYPGRRDPRGGPGTP